LKLGGLIDEAQLLAGKRIGLLTAAASRLGGGVFESVVLQSQIVHARGGTPVIFALADQYSADDCARFGDCEVRLASILGPAEIGFAPSLIPQLLEARLDLVHLNGIWMYPSRAGAVWARRTGRPYFVSPRGMLDPWILARSRLKKWLARQGYEHQSWRAATALHGLTDKEAGDIARSAARNDTIVIPNPAPAAAAAPRSATGNDYLYIGRIHAKKNIGALIEAWSMLAAKHELPVDARLIIAGWGAEQDEAALRAALQNAPPSIQFIGPAYGETKRKLLESARFLVLPTLSEGMPRAVLEAWAAGTPVLMSEECNLPEGFRAGAAIDCGMTAESIAISLDRANRMGGPSWADMSRAALGLASGPFSVAAVADQWEAVYSAAISAAPGRLKGHDRSGLIGMIPNLRHGA
jgi:poly(glycerol-phosphate) alpha-glucosyltransferase